MNFSIDALASHAPDAGAPRARPRNLYASLKRLSRETFLQFLVLGALIFAVAHVAQREHAVGFGKGVGNPLRHGLQRGHVRGA